MTFQSLLIARCTQSRWAQLLELN